MPDSRGHYKIRQAWIVRLHTEYDGICWAYGVGLQRPLIDISEAESYWGQWNPGTRTLTVSESLILNYSWDIVLAILKHEMAHQIATDLFKSRDKHGEAFQRACDMIGVPEGFTGASGDLPRTVSSSDESGASSPGRAVLEKVRKLLSLARSANEHEAALAMQKANELIEKHNLDRLDRPEPSNYIHATIELRRKRIENYHKRICSILMDFFFVEVVLSYLYDAQNDAANRAIDLMGTPENVRIAEYVFHFLMNQLDLLWRDYRKKTRKPDAYKRSYWLGVLQGFRDKLSAQETERRRSDRRPVHGSASMGALILAQDQGLARFVKKRYPRLSRRSDRGARIESGTYRAGVTDGRDLTLHHGLTQTDGNRGKLISHRKGQLQRNRCPNGGSISNCSPWCPNTRLIRSKAHSI